MSTIGKSVHRIDAKGKVTGHTLYPGDINMPNQSYAKTLFANRPHAIIRRIDTSLAEALDGVIAVFTAKDVPVNEYGLNFKDQPVVLDVAENVRQVRNELFGDNGREVQWVLGEQTSFEGKPDPEKSTFEQVLFHTSLPARGADAKAAVIVKKLHLVLKNEW